LSNALRALWNCGPVEKFLNKIRNSRSD